MWILGPSIDYNYNLVLIGFEYPISNEYPTSNIKRPFDIRFTTSIWKSNVQYQSTVGYSAKFYVECEFWAQVLITTPSYWINRCFHFAVVIATWAEFGTLDCRMLHFSSCNSYLNRNLQLSPLWIWISNIQRISNVQYQTTVWYSVHDFNLKIQRPISINCWIFC